MHKTTVPVGGLLVVVGDIVDLARRRNGRHTAGMMMITVPVTGETTTSLARRNPLPVQALTKKTHLAS